VSRAVCPFLLVFFVLLVFASLLLLRREKSTWNFLKELVWYLLGAVVDRFEGKD
jgi:cytochrome c oxidase assembly factor CtaG